MVKKNCLREIQFFWLWAIIGCFTLGPTFGAKVYKNQISPNWSEDDSYFWYCNDLAEGAKEYILVDLKKGVREPAFDTG